MPISFALQVNNSHPLNICYYWTGESWGSGRVGAWAVRHLFIIIRIKFIIMDLPPTTSTSNMHSTDTFDIPPMFKGIIHVPPPPRGIYLNNGDNFKFMVTDTIELLNCRSAVES